MIKPGIHIGDEVRVEYGNGGGKKQVFTGKLMEYYEDPDFWNEGYFKLEFSLRIFAGENQWIKIFLTNNK